MRDKSCGEVTPTTTPNPPTTTSPPPSAMDCTFEEGEVYFKMLNGIIKTLLLHHRKLTLTGSELTSTGPIFLSIWQMLCAKYPVCWRIFFTLHIIRCQPGLCSWVQEVNNDVNWTRSTGLEVQDKPWDGPQYDHTFGNNEGINRSAFLKTLNELRVKSWRRVKKHHVKQPLSKLAKAWHQRITNH